MRMRFSLHACASLIAATGLSLVLATAGTANQAPDDWVSNNAADTTEFFDQTAATTPDIQPGVLPEDHFKMKADEGTIAKKSGKTLAIPAIAWVGNFEDQAVHRKKATDDTVARTAVHGTLNRDAARAAPQKTGNMGFAKLKSPAMTTYADTDETLRELASLSATNGPIEIDTGQPTATLMTLAKMKKKAPGYASGQLNANAPTFGSG